MREFFWMKTFHHNSHVFFLFNTCSVSAWNLNALKWSACLVKICQNWQKKKKHSRLLQPRDARRNVITRRLLHIAKPADMLSFAGSPHPIPHPHPHSDYCALRSVWAVVRLWSWCEFFPRSLCCFCHTYKEGSTWRRRRGGPFASTFFCPVCLFLTQDQTLHHRCIHGFTSARMHFTSVCSFIWFFYIPHKK